MDIDNVPMKPCPFCKSERVDVAVDGLVFFVKCLRNRCQAEGPSADCRQAAIEAWNKRPKVVIFIGGSGNAGSFQEIYGVHEDDYELIDYDNIPSGKCPICCGNLDDDSGCDECNIDWQAHVSNQDVLKKMRLIEDMRCTNCGWKGVNFTHNSFGEPRCPQCDSGQPLVSP